MIEKTSKYGVMLTLREILVESLILSKELELL